MNDIAAIAKAVALITSLLSDIKFPSKDYLSLDRIYLSILIQVCTDLFYAEIIEFLKIIPANYYVYTF